MWLQILTLPIIWICVCGTAPDHEPTHAVSRQSFHRDDVPLSYTYTSVHIYTTPQPQQRQYNQQNNHYQGSSKYKPIQYAPLDQNSYQSDKQKYEHVPEQSDEYNNEQVTEPLLQHSLDDEKNLEPRILAENLDAHNQNYRSYVPGHNIEVLQSKHVLGNNGLYRAYHNNLQNQQIKIPKFTIQQKPEQLVKHTLESFKASEQRPLSEERNILYTFLPKPISNTQQNAYGEEKPYSFNQALSAKTPRLHLNIARVYGIAHLPQQGSPAQFNRPSIEKPPSHTQAIFLPLKLPFQQKTILYPVQDTNKNYPIHT